MTHNGDGVTGSGSTPTSSTSCFFPSVQTANTRGDDSRRTPHHIRPIFDRNPATKHYAVRRHKLLLYPAQQGQREHGLGKLPRFLPTLPYSGARYSRSRERAWCSAANQVAPHLALSQCYPWSMVLIVCRRRCALFTLPRGWMYSQQGEQKTGRSGSMGWYWLLRVVYKKAGVVRR